MKLYNVTLFCSLYLVFAVSLNAQIECLNSDVNNDGIVSVNDILVFTSEYGSNCNDNCGDTDINGDGVVSVEDLFLLLAYFGNECDGATIPTVQSTSTFNVSVEEGIVYAQGLSHESLNSSNSTAMDLLLDAYIPEGAGENKPAIILIHGGGFVGGGRQQSQIVNMAQYFASRGWAVFSIDYRLAGDLGTVPQQWLDVISALPLNPVEAVQGMAIYPAHRDAKAATRWIVSHADEYGINTDYLTIGGGSAGAITAIGISVTESEAYLEEISLLVDPTLSTTHTDVTYNVKTILDFWGSKISVDALQIIYGIDSFDSDDPPLFIAHGTEDTTVLYSDALALQNVYTNINVPYILHSLEGEGHSPWGATINGFTLESMAFDFITTQQALIIE